MGTEKKGNESVIKGNEVNQREWKKGKEVNEIEAFFCFFYFCNFETVHNILFLREIKYYFYSCFRVSVSYVFQFILLYKNVCN